MGLSLLVMVLYPVNISNPTFLLLVLHLLAQQDEIARLKKQEEHEKKALSEKIKGGTMLGIFKFILKTSSYNLRK